MIQKRHDRVRLEIFLPLMASHFLILRSGSLRHMSWALQPKGLRDRRARFTNSPITKDRV